MLKRENATIQSQALASGNYHVDFCGSGPRGSQWSRRLLRYGGHNFSSSAGSTSLGIILFWLHMAVWPPKTLSPKDREDILAVSNVKR